MTENEIKKWFYINNPTAELIQVTSSVLNYVVHIKDEQHQLVIRILVPLEEIGDASFFPKMEAKHLIRWLVLEESGSAG